RDYCDSSMTELLAVESAVIMFVKECVALDILSFVFAAYPRHRHRHPFPTRRSSDLARTPCGRSGGGPSSRACTPPSTAPPGSCRDRKSTRLNSSHLVISYAVFCLKKKIQFSLFPSSSSCALSTPSSSPPPPARTRTL